jgi:hypothetical protein
LVRVGACARVAEFADVLSGGRAGIKARWWDDSWRCGGRRADGAVVYSGGRRADEAVVYSGGRRADEAVVYSGGRRADEAVVYSGGRRADGAVVYSGGCDHRGGSEGSGRGFGFAEAASWALSFGLLLDFFDFDLFDGGSVIVVVIVVIVVGCRGVGRSCCVSIRGRSTL